jgi:hypothetical protein
MDDTGHLVSITFIRARLGDVDTRAPSFPAPASYDGSKRKPLWRIADVLEFEKSRSQPTEL